MSKKIDYNSYWQIDENPISRTGIFPYLGRQISPLLEPNKVYDVLRPEEELFSQETMNSFKLKPLVNDHCMLGEDFTPAEKHGIHGVLGERIGRKGDFLVANMEIYSETIKNEIRNGKKELSLGYFCDYDLTPGTYRGRHYDAVQRNLRGNHIALVDKGRMGHDVRVMDGMRVNDAKNVLVYDEMPFVEDYNPNHDPDNGQFTENEIFAFRGKDLEKTKKEIENAIDDPNISEGKVISFGELPKLYEYLGLPTGILRTNKKNMLKGLGKIPGTKPHHVKKDDLKNLPVLIADPVAIFKSNPGSTNPNAYVALLNAFGENGDPVIAAIAPRNGKNYFITSVHDREEFASFMLATALNHNILYVQDKKTFTQLLVQFHSSVKVSSNSIPDKKAVVKHFMEKNKKESEDSMGKQPLDDLFSELNVLLSDVNEELENFNSGETEKAAAKEKGMKDEKESKNPPEAADPGEEKKARPEEESAEDKKSCDGGKSARIAEILKGKTDEQTIAAVMEALGQPDDTEESGDGDDQKAEGKKEKETEAKDKKPEGKEDGKQAKKEASAEDAALSDSVFDRLEAEIASRIAARDALVSRLKPIIGEFKGEAMTKRQVIEYACDALSLTEKTEKALTACLDRKEAEGTAYVKGGGSNHSVIERFLKGE